MTIVQVNRITQFLRCTPSATSSSVTDLKLQLGGIVHFAVVVNISHPEREHIVRTLGYLQVRLGSTRHNLPRRFLTTVVCIKQCKVVALLR